MIGGYANLPLVRIGGSAGAGGLGSTGHGLTIPIFVGETMEIRISGRSN